MITVGKYAILHTANKLCKKIREVFTRKFVGNSVVY